MSRVFSSSNTGANQNYVPNVESSPSISDREADDTVTVPDYASVPRVLVPGVQFAATDDSGNPKSDISLHYTQTNWND